MADATDKMLTDVAKEYEAAKVATDKAIEQLNTRIQTPPQVDEETYDTTWQSTLYAGVAYNSDPVGAITAVDDMVKTVNALATQIGQIVFVPPTAIPDFQMSNHKEWVDAFADKIETSLSSYIDSMGIPDKSYQDAIFNESYDRNLQTLNVLLELADAKTGSRVLHIQIA